MMDIINIKVMFKESQIRRSSWFGKRVAVLVCFILLFGTIPCLAGMI